MASTEHVLRIRRIVDKKALENNGDSERSEFVFLNVSCVALHPINLRLLATEGENAYAASLNSTQIQAARDTKSSLTPSEWTETLLSLLLQRSSNVADTSSSSTDEKIELVASIVPSPSPELNLIIRKNISGITQRLGILTLPHNDAEILDTLHWTSIAIDRATALSQSVVSLTASSKAAERTVASLNSQVEELLAAKEAHELLLLQKCTELLNQKKVKIRELQRLLACTTSSQQRHKGEQGKTPVNGSKGADGKARVKLKEAPEGGDRGVRKSNTRKRKAGDAALTTDPNDGNVDEEEAFNESLATKIKVEDADGDEDMDENTAETPQTSGNVTEDEVENGTADHERVEEEDTTMEDISEREDGKKGTIEGRAMTASDLPPDRALPFGERASKPAMSTPAQEEGGKRKGNEDGDVDEETDDDDDDEL